MYDDNVDVEKTINEKNSSIGRKLGLYAFWLAWLILISVLFVFIWEYFKKDKVDFDKLLDLASLGVWLFGIVWGAVGASGFAKKKFNFNKDIGRAK